MEFNGYLRKNGVGVRNYVGIMATVGCSADIVQKIAQIYPKVKPIVHHQGCAQTPPDIANVENVLINVALNPNLFSVLLVNLGCESTSLEKIADAVSKVKDVETVTIEERGMSKAISKGLDMVKKMYAESKTVKREKCDISELKLAIKCGASDTTSGIISNPVAGKVADRIIELGGTVLFGETTELIGAEHILARRAANKEIADKLYSTVSNIEQRATSMGVDIRGGQPTRGNIRGGITTLEEKSLGSICKTGSSKLIDVIDYGEMVTKKGLTLMDGPGREPEALTGFAAGGAQVILFSTGSGAPQGFPIVPVIKTSGNPNVCYNLSEHIDADLSPVFYGHETIDSAAEKILNQTIEVASGKSTKAEILGYDGYFEIYCKGPVI